MYYVISFTFSGVSINSGKLVNLLGFLAFLILIGKSNGTPVIKTLNQFTEEPNVRKTPGLTNVTSNKQGIANNRMGGE